MQRTSTAAIWNVHYKTVRLMKQSDYGLKPSQDMYEDWQNNYDFLNERLFGFELPNCLITLQRRNGTYGYFKAETFKREDGEQCDEIALNPSHYDPDQPIGLLSTLAHEMVHLWQHHYGSPGRGRYHNREWADKMIALGLQPSHTGKPGGRETGDTMNHLIIRDGTFERSANELLQIRPAMTWVERDMLNKETPLPSSTILDEETSAPKSGRRFRYECPYYEVCRQCFEGRYGLAVLCKEHQLEMTIVPRKKRRAGDGLTETLAIDA